MGEHDKTAVKRDAAPEQQPAEPEAHEWVDAADNPDMPNTDRPAGTPGGPSDPSLNYSPSAE